LWSSLCALVELCADACWRAGAAQVEPALRPSVGTAPATGTAAAASEAAAAVVRRIMRGFIRSLSLSRAIAVWIA
jgi:hypothetical protein